MDKINTTVITLSHLIIMIDIIDEYITQDTQQELTEHGWKYIQATLHLINNQLKTINSDLENILKDE